LVAEFCNTAVFYKNREIHSKGEITKGTRQEIIVSLGWEVWKHTQFPTSEEYNGICQSLVQKHPDLKDTIGNGYVSLIL